MTKKKKKGGKVGQGMKPRNSSAVAVQQEEPKQPLAEASEGVESIGSLENGKVQNLDPAATMIVKTVQQGLATYVGPDEALEHVEVLDQTEEGVAKRNLEDLMRDSTDARQGVTTETVAPISEPGALRRMTLEEEAALANYRGKITFRPNDAALGHQQDGTFNIILTLPEGLIEPIREQAESDKITPEEWCRIRFLEYIESWWSPPQGR